MASMQTTASPLVTIAMRYSASARAKRVESLSKHVKLEPDNLVLDLGGGTGDHFHSIFPDHRKVVIADILEDDLRQARERHGYETVQLVDGIGTLPFPDQNFDFVFCSSVLEHVTGPKDAVEWTRSGPYFETTGRQHQWAFANEIRRIAKRYYVQTPYRYFILESHSWLPGLIVFLPRPALVALLRLTNTFWPKQTSPDWRLLTIGEFSAMFPEAKIEREKSLGFVKSLMAIKA
ncbi:class I SAM-dependent methyltransferase [Bradyrhizobium sp. Tv2a-2]|uniref:class I SAM-dependent methyltransferase n=1 Tax=Bradyrhizobium sp. Tv2a-2 TaxID=113395 RepID=UPI001FD90704|nr:class I SAM-dependent methyltransferase [Bradyrhizobium sp. Tv2a-2]